MKQPYSILSLLIPGKSGPDNNIDVYLQPLVEELKQLWDVGSITFDASTREYFNMHAALMWTINDFPAYANLSRWSTKGYKACPCCMNDTNSMRLPNCSKICYMDHRCFLSSDHKWRDSKTFNGKPERRDPPAPLSGHDILSHLHDFKDRKFGKTVTHPKRGDNWKKKSIFFDLPYWSSLLLRHNLDVMHIEKNVCDNILGTLLDIEGKIKDSIKARHDLKLLKIMKHLAPKLINGKWHIPPAPYTLSKSQKDKVFKFLKGLKVPDGYSSNISKCINLDKRKILGLKSHDCHVILEQLLPFSIRGVSQPKVYEVIAKISIFFKELCSRTLNLEVLDRIQDSIILTLCEMEKIFLPSFFDIMVHLCVHLPAEAKIAGPVQYRWMYPVERLLRKFKCYVRNRNRPEGSIAEGYIIEECMNFCSKYLSEIETKFNQYERNADKQIEVTQAHEYVLRNCEEAETYISEYTEGLFDDCLSKWFQDRISCLFEEGDGQVLQDLKTLSLGPFKGVQYFSGFLANGFRFHTRDVETKRRNQNSGVMVKGVGHDYYGVLTDIICLRYLDGNRVVLFRCDWWDVHSPGRGVKVDKFGFVSVNSKKRLHTTEPFVLMSQAEQVFYVKDGIDPNWLMVVKTHPRHHYDILEKEQCENDGDALQQSHPGSTYDEFLATLSVDYIDTTSELIRDDMEDTVVDSTNQNQPKELNVIGTENDNIDESSDDDEDFSDNDRDEEVDEDIDIA
ncbi:uncharacterized protein LOC141602161 [Silene latifolia]|uniref:uncharacterized protein LOC141602161 n=1 Tax=Silene latifolia TaxID=37657 RepID=UPI003D76B0C6